MNYHYRLVRFYYFEISDRNEEGYYKSVLVKQKIEVNNKAFDIKDIFGMEKFLKQDEGDEDDKLCIICCGAVANILILPCLHLNICATCITDYKNRNPNDKSCPVCRQSK